VDIKLTADKVTGWIKSCTNEVHLEICTDIVSSSIPRMYKDKVPAQVIEYEQKNLSQAITDRRIEMKSEVVRESFA
jgi:hypothetical protein